MAAATRGHHSVGMESVVSSYARSWTQPFSISTVLRGTMWTTPWRLSPSSSVETNSHMASTAPSDSFLKSMTKWPKPLLLASHINLDLSHLQLTLASHIHCVCSLSDWFCLRRFVI